MSGTFEYYDWHIEMIAERIEEVLEMQGAKMPLMVCDTFSPMVREEMENAVALLRMSRVYAKRIDCYLSGDEDEHRFLFKLKKELGEIKPPKVLQKSKE